MIYIRADDLELSVKDAINYQRILETGRSIERDALRFLLTKLIARDLELEADGDDVNDLIIEWRYMVELEKGSAFNQFLNDNQIDVSLLYERFEIEVLRKAILDNIQETEVAQYYIENKSTFETAELLSLITDDLDLVQEIKDVVLEDEKFQGFAAAYSLDEETNKLGGYIGFKKRVDLPGEAEAAVFDANPGQVIGPFKIDRERYQLYQVLNMERPKIEDADRDIREILFEASLRKRRLETDIEIFPI